MMKIDEEGEADEISREDEDEGEETEGKRDSAPDEPSISELTKKLKSYKSKYEDEKRQRREDAQLHRRGVRGHARDLEFGANPLRRTISSEAPEGKSASQVPPPARRPTRHSIVVGPGGAGLQATLQPRQEATEAWERRIEEHEEKLAERQVQLEQFEKEIEQIEGYLDRRQDICNRKDHELKELHEELEVLQAELLGYRGDLRAERDAAAAGAPGSDVGSAESLRQLHAQLATAATSSAEKDSEIERLQLQVAALEGQIREKDATVEYLTGRSQNTLYLSTYESPKRGSSTSPTPNTSDAHHSQPLNFSRPRPQTAAATSCYPSPVDDGKSSSRKDSTNLFDSYADEDVRREVDDKAASKVDVDSRPHSAKSSRSPKSETCVVM